jgi:hypothetical protein
VDCLFLLAGVGVSLSNRDWPPLAVAALLWLLCRELPTFVQPDARRAEAVRIQEQFDCSFPGLTWNGALNGVPEQPHRILALAENHQVKMPPDYWVDTSRLPDGVGTLFRQAQSAAWGQEGHTRYWKTNATIAASALCAAGGLAWWLDLSFADGVVKIFAPMAPFLVGRIQAASSHRAEAEERSEMTRFIENLLRYPAPPSETVVQSIQARLFRSRLTGGRIPQWLYNRYKDKDRSSIDQGLGQAASSWRARE